MGRWGGGEVRLRVVSLLVFPAFFILLTQCTQSCVFHCLHRYGFFLLLHEALLTITETRQHRCHSNASHVVSGAGPPLLVLLCRLSPGSSGAGFGGVVVSCVLTRVLIFIAGFLGNHSGTHRLSAGCASGAPPG